MKLLASLERVPTESYTKQNIKKLGNSVGVFLVLICVYSCNQKVQGVR